MAQFTIVTSRFKRLWNPLREPLTSPKTRTLTIGGRRLVFRRLIRGKKPLKARKPIIADVSVLTLEKLPPLILDMIFEYVQSSELAKLAGLSRVLYWPIVRRIYRSITFARTSDNQERAEWSIGTEINFGTRLPEDRVEMFVKTLKKNPSLRHLVQSVNITCSIPAQCANKLFSMMTKVKAYYAELGGFQSENFFTQSEKLTVFLSRPPPLSPYLVELRILAYYGSSGHKEKCFQTLAQDFVWSGCHLNLRKLHIASKPPQDQTSVLGPRAPPSQHPHWITFLDELIAQKVNLQLTALGLYGEMDNFTKTTIQKLRRCIDLRELRTLVLHITQEEQQVLGHTFMEQVTRYTPQLDSLAIFPISTNPTRPSSAICNMLENNIPNQLKELVVSYCPDLNSHEGRNIAHFDRNRIQETILKSQRRLVKLKLEEGKWLLYQKGWSEDLRLMFSDSLSKAWQRESWRQEDFPCIFGDLHVTPRLSNVSIELVRTQLTTFRAVLKEDSICANSATALPFLKQYIIDSVAFDLKKGGIIVNGETFLFDQVSGTHNQPSLSIEDQRPHTPS